MSLERHFKKSHRIRLPSMIRAPWDWVHSKIEHDLPLVPAHHIAQTNVAHNVPNMHIAADPNQLPHRVLQDKRLVQEAMEFRQSHDFFSHATANIYDHAEDLQHPSMKLHPDKPSSELKPDFYIIAGAIVLLFVIISKK